MFFRDYCLSLGEILQRLSRWSCGGGDVRYVNVSQFALSTHTNSCVVGFPDMYWASTPLRRLKALIRTYGPGASMASCLSRHRLWKPLDRFVELLRPGMHRRKPS